MAKEMDNWGTVPWQYGVIKVDRVQKVHKPVVHTDKPTPIHPFKDLLDKALRRKAL